MHLPKCKKCKVYITDGDTKDLCTSCALKTGAQKLSQGMIGALHNVTEFAISSMKHKDLMGYTNEMGAIISPQNYALHYVQGSAGHVDFPTELAWSLHKKNPGIVYKFAHVHPPGMSEPSTTDLNMLKAWTMALHPFPARLSVITYLDNDVISEQIYLGQFEGKEEWLKHKERPREYTAILEEINYVTQIMPSHKIEPEWLRYLLKHSYHGRLS